MATSWPAMERRGPVVTEADVRAFEKKLGATLPDDYRAFLLEVNGGRTVKQQRSGKAVPESDRHAKTGLGCVHGDQP